MTNAERQRKFCAAHPGYYARLKARERAGKKRSHEQYLAALRASLAETATGDDSTKSPAPAQR